MGSGERETCRAEGSGVRVEGNGAPNDLGTASRGRVGKSRRSGQVVVGAGAEDDLVPARHRRATLLRAAGTHGPVPDFPPQSVRAAVPGWSSGFGSAGAGFRDSVGVVGANGDGDRSCSLAASRSPRRRRRASSRSAVSPRVCCGSSARLIAARDAAGLDVGRCARTAAARGAARCRTRPARSPRR